MMSAPSRGPRKEVVGFDRIHERLCKFTEFLQAGHKRKRVTPWTSRAPFTRVSRCQWLQTSAERA
jgi:hypothetical protein